MSLDFVDSTACDLRTWSGWRAGDARSLKRKTLRGLVVVSGKACVGPASGRSARPEESQVMSEQTCPTCEGWGRVFRAYRDERPDIGEVITCPDCKGTGQREVKDGKQAKIEHVDR